MKIESRDLLKFRFIENPQFNPSGKILAFQLARSDEARNDYFRDIYLYENDRCVRLTDGLSSSIVMWLNDDELLVRQAKEPGKPGYSELLRYNVHSREKETFLNVPLAIGQIKKVRDDLFVAVCTIDGNEPDQYLLKEDEYGKAIEARKKEADYEVLDEVPYWFNGGGFVNKSRRALFTIQMDPLKITRITEPLFNVGSLEVFGDLAYYTGSVMRVTRPKHNQIYCLNTKDNSVEAIYSGDDYSIGNLFVMNDQLYCSASDQKTYGGNETSCFHRVEKERLIKIPTPDRTLGDSVATDTLLGSGSGRKVHDGEYYTLATNVDHVELWKFDKDFNCTSLISSPLISCFDIGEDGIVFLGGSETALPELYKIDIDGSNLRQITSFNKDVLKDKYVAAPQSIEYVSEGETLNGWVLLPEEYESGESFPAVLDVHGGPRGIYSATFFHEMQLWASQGYVVFFTNIHGSDGRGDEFADIRGKYGSIDFKNLMDFTDKVLESYPKIDQKRVCVTGGSYGGFMTNWIIGHTDRFAAAASQRSISNWMSFAYVSDIGPTFACDQQGVEDPVEQMQQIWDLSPLKYAGNAKTPTLFIHSDQDYRCPLPEGMQMMQALAVRGVETRMCLFHGENHELSRGGKPLHRIRRLDEITNWFNKHVK